MKCKEGYRLFEYIFIMNLPSFLMTPPVPRKRKDIPRGQGDDMIPTGKFFAEVVRGGEGGGGGVKEKSLPNLIDP